MTHAEILSNLYKTTFGFAPAEVNPIAGAGSAVITSLLRPKLVVTYP